VRSAHAVARGHGFLAVPDRHHQDAHMLPRRRYGSPKSVVGTHRTRAPGRFGAGDAQPRRLTGAGWGFPDALFRSRDVTLGRPLGTSRTSCSRFLTPRSSTPRPPSRRLSSCVPPCKGGWTRSRGSRSRRAGGRRAGPGSPVKLATCGWHERGRAAPYTDRSGGLSPPT